MKLYATFVPLQKLLTIGSITETPSIPVNCRDSCHPLTGIYCSLFNSVSTRKYYTGMYMNGKKVLNVANVSKVVGIRVEKLSVGLQ
jgi:hypothetical protein